MNTPKIQSVEPKPKRLWFQFSLRTLLLLFVVLGSSLAVFGALGIVVFILTVGLSLFLHEVKSWWSLTHLALGVLGLLCLIGLLIPATSTSHVAGNRNACFNNLKQIALAMHNYHQSNGCFPPAYIADQTGKPMHSWRVLILPYLNQNDLYKAYDFTEPWDGPKNKKLLASRPSLFACRSDPDAGERGSTRTSYFAVVGPNAAWAGVKPRTIGDFAGKTSDTIMLIEAADSGIDWTEPRDLSLNAIGAAETMPPAISVWSNHGHRADFFWTYDYHTAVNAATVDGSVLAIPSDGLLTENLRTILPIGGCKEQEIYSFEDKHSHETQHLNWPNIASLAVWLLSVGTLLTHAVRSRKVRSGLPQSPQSNLLSTGSTSGPLVE